MLRILHTESSIGFGGQEIRILIEAKELRKKGYNVEIACQPNSWIEKFAKELHIQIYNIGMRNKYDIVAIINFIRLMKRIRPDIVNTHSLIDSYLASIAARILGNIKIIRTRHLTIPTNSKLIYRLPHKIITAGEAIRKDIINRNKIHPEKVICIPTGVDIERFNPGLYDGKKIRREFDISQDEYLVGMLAFIRKMKGYPVFIEAASKVLRSIPNVKFLIVGGDVENKESELKNHIKKLGIESSFIFTGFRRDIPEILSAIDVSVLSSLEKECIPQAISHSLAMEKPVVATDIGNISDLVKNGITGILVPPGNIDALATGILTLLSAPEMRKRMGKAGRQLIEEKFTLNQMIDKTEKVYAELLS
jgi:glycosyltransferase involved in cell wall biosynthesis